MPNHIKNFLTIKAEGERLAEILESIKDDEKGVGTIDFRKLIPLPQIQEVPESPFTQQGYALYKQYMNEKNKFCLEKAEPIVYSHGTYFGCGEQLGTFGFSVKKKK